MATAPETAASMSTSAGWLDPFLEEWRPGTGEPRAVREPATDRPLLTLAQSTPSDVARAAATAAAAQPAWAEATYADRAEVLRRAAEVYEANRPEIGTWTQRETGAHRNKMFHEQNFAVGEMHAAATLPYQPYGSLVPTRAAVHGSPRPSRGRRRDHALEFAKRPRNAGRRARPSSWKCRGSQA